MCWSAHNLDVLSVYVFSLSWLQFVCILSVLFMSRRKLLFERPSGTRSTSALQRCEFFSSRSEEQNMPVSYSALRGQCGDGNIPSMFLNAWCFWTKVRGIFIYMICVWLMMKHIKSVFPHWPYAAKLYRALENEYNLCSNEFNQLYCQFNHTESTFKE